MLYVYFGTDKESARKKVQATVANMLSKNPDALYFRITQETVGGFSPEELAQSQALFKSEYIVVCDSLLESVEGEEFVIQNIEQFAESPHPIFVLEAALKAPQKKKCEKFAVKMQEFSLKEKASAERFNTFSLTDALASRDTKTLWTLFRDAKRHGVSDEEIHGILFWMLKTLVLTASADSAQDAGLKPFPYQKAQRSLARFESKEVLHERLARFALLPQHARRRKIPLEIELERYILSYT